MPRINKNLPFKTGVLKLKNPGKYIGDVKELVYRSSWEYQFFIRCDQEDSVLSWGSEIIAIPYMKPIGTPPYVKRSVYYPDVYMVYVNSSGKTIKELLEIKPEKQTKPSAAKTASKKLMENQVYAVNCAKWEAAKEWAKQHGAVFNVYTEKALGLFSPRKPKRNK